MNTTTTDLISQSITLTAKQIAKVAEKAGADYSVPVLTDDGTRADAFTNIRFRRHASGRRNTTVVEGVINGRRAAFNSDATLRVLLDPPPAPKPVLLTADEADIVIKGLSFMTHSEGKLATGIVNKLVEAGLAHPRF